MAAPVRVSRRPSGWRAGGGPDRPERLGHHEGRDVRRGGDEITIGDDVMFASDVQVRCDDGHPIFDVPTGLRVNVSRSITIGAHVWLGLRSAVLGGVSIGAGTVVGLGSIVTKDLPNNVIAVGTPAKIVRRDIAWERPHLTLPRPISSRTPRR